MLRSYVLRKLLQTRGRAYATSHSRSLVWTLVKKRIFRPGRVVPVTLINNRPTAVVIPAKVIRFAVLCSIIFLTWGKLLRFPGLSTLTPIFAQFRHQSQSPHRHSVPSMHSILFTSGSLRRSMVKWPPPRMLWSLVHYTFGISIPVEYRLDVWSHVTTSLDLQLVELSSVAYYIFRDRILCQSLVRVASAGRSCWCSVTWSSVFANALIVLPVATHRQHRAQ